MTAIFLHNAIVYKRILRRISLRYNIITIVYSSAIFSSVCKSVQVFVVHRKVNIYKRNHLSLTITVDYCFKKCKAMCMLCNNIAIMKFVWCENSLYIKKFLLHIVFAKI